MRALVVAALLFALMAGLARAQSPATNEDQAGIEALISGQFADFQKGDLEAAFDKASPMIRQMFQTPGRFGDMVRGSYPAIWAGEDVTFLGLRNEDGRLLQRLRLRGPDGVLAFFDYEVIRMDGVWRINGVWPVKDQSPSA